MTKRCIDVRQTDDPGVWELVVKPIFTLGNQQFNWETESCYRTSLTNAIYAEADEALMYAAEKQAVRVTLHMPIRNLTFRTIHHDNMLILTNGLDMRRNSAGDIYFIDNPSEDVFFRYLVSQLKKYKRSHPDHYAELATRIDRSREG